MQLSSYTYIYSPAYMAPEQLEGRVLTLKADVWAVGINLWEFATQKLPWADEAMRESPNGVADYEYCLRKVAVFLSLSIF
jgi:serine/threonine protein kinase